MQKLFIHVTSLNLSEFEDKAYFECSFISSQMFSPYYPIEKNSKANMYTTSLLNHPCFSRFDFGEKERAGCFDLNVFLLSCSCSVLCLFLAVRGLAYGLWLWHFFLSFFFIYIIPYALVDILDMVCCRAVQVC